MTRLEQAMQWWISQKRDVIYRADIPIRHFEVLKKNKAIKRNFVFGGLASYRLVKREPVQ
jgi:hypothetical protein